MFGMVLNVGSAKSFGVRNAVIIGVTVRVVVRRNTPQCPRFAGSWKRYDGHLFYARGQNNESNEECSDSRRLIETYSASLPEDERAIVRAAMGLEPACAPQREASLQGLSAKRAQLEKRQVDMAKRILDT